MSGLRANCLSGEMFLRLFTILAIFCAPLLGSAQEEDLTDPVVAYNKAISAIQLEKWDEALSLCNGVIAEHGEGALKRFGPVFGHFHFLKGLAFLGKKDAPGAIASLKTCYEKFSNEILKSGSDDEIKNLLPNLFLNAALVQWANAEMMQENYKGARDIYEKVLVVGKNDSKINLIYVGVNLGRCYLKSGELEKGYQFMVRPLANENLSDGLRKTIYMVIAEDWTPEVEFPEVREFIQSYSTIVDQAPFLDRYDRNDQFQYLAQYSLQAQDPVRALGWYERMVNPRLLKPEFDRRYDSLKNRFVSKQLGEKKAAALKDLEGQIGNLEKGYLQILNGVGSAHFMMQNFAGSFVAFSRLSDEAGKAHSERPVFLHNAVVSAAQIEQWKEAYQYGKQFLDDFPDHELKPGVARVLVELLFLREDYEEAYKISGEIRQDMTQGEEIRDIPDFVYGASAFQLGHMEEAETELSSYFKVYEQGERKEMVHFYLGLSKVQLQKWEEAVEVFSSFIEVYPESQLLPPVLYQAALSEFMIDRLEDSVAKVERIHSEYPNHEVGPPAWNLKGDLLNALEGAYSDIEACYLGGRDGGVKMNQAQTVEYALWQLVIQTSDQEEWKKAEEHYAHFQKDYPNSDYRHDLLVASLPMLLEQDRAEEGLSKLREVVWKNRSEAESTVLSEMFGSYVDFIDSNFDAEVLREQMSGLRTEPGTTPALRGWTTVVLVDQLEKEEASQDEINKLYYQLEAGFDPAEHSNYPTVRLARWVSDIRKKPQEAKMLYEYILDNRPGTANYEYCLVDVAQIEAQSEDAPVREEAMKKFQRVVSSFPDDELQEKSVLGMARIRMAEENYEEAKTHWAAYLENRGWNIARAEANYQMGFANEKMGNLADAMKIYVSVYANFPGYLDWSTRAYLRAAAITKARGEDLKALKILQDMLKRMGHHKHPGVAKAKSVFGEWRKEYAKKMAQQEKE